MDVVKFKYSSLSRDATQRIRDAAGWDIDAWLELQYNGKICRVRDNGVVQDMIIEMPKEKYMEFCLQWM